ncbi:MAG: helicase-exonuclease AddAB subunit AddA [Proteocatella sp.]
MSNNWTNEQLEAINSREKNLLVSAAAGSGKTAVLVERIANLVEQDKEDIESMLIVTFTNAAARQMKDRIQKKLQERIINIRSKANCDVDELNFLKKQIKNISRASISTVHSFCIEVLRQNFQLIDIDPGFKIANESLINILKNKAIENIFEENYESEDEGFLRLVDAFGGEKSDKGLVEILNQLHYFIQAQPYPLRWLNEKSELYNFSEFKDSVWAQEIKNNTLYQLNDILKSCEEALELCFTYSPPLAYIENLEDDKKQIESVIASLEIYDFESYLKKLQEFKLSRLKIISKKAIETNQYDEDIIEAIKDIRNNIIKEEIKSLSGAFGDVEFSQLVEDIKYMKPYVESLIKLVKQFDEEYKKLKSEKSVLDFSDIEHYTLKILEDEKVSQSLRQKYKYIFFDEYQDSNLVQETIIDAVKRENNLFFVGDVKQSIYRFRLSDPNLFNKRYERYSNENLSCSLKIDLAKNFRSRKEILDFCNLIFKNIMTKEHGEVDYQDESHQLKAGKKASEDIANTKTKNISLNIIEKKSKELEDEEIPENDELEAVFCSQKILKLVEKNEISYKDIVILMRSPKGKAKIFEKIFNKYNIPCYVDFQTSSFSKVEIKCILDYLRIIDNDNQDEALLGSMVSAFGGFTTEDIIKIRIAYPNLRFYEAVKTYLKEGDDSSKEEPPKDSELYSKLNKFYSKIEEYRFLEKMWKLSDLVEYILDDTNYMTYISGLQDSEQKLINIKSFVEKTREYETNETLGLLGFLRQIDKILKEKGDSTEKTMLAEAENAVTIMSIHKSKGLEFDTVFLCDLGKRINEIDLRADIILHNELGIGMKYKNVEQNIQADSIPRNYIKLKKSLENISEEIRILYVALTRAIDKLYMVGTVNDIEKFKANTKKGNISQIVKKQKNYLSWISASVENSKTEFKDIEINYIMPEEIKQSEEQRIEDKEEIRNQILNYELKDEKNKELFSTVSSYIYPYQSDTVSPSKKTVTELTKSYKKEDEVYEFQEIKLNKVPLFMQEGQTLSSTEIGTIMHMIMEKISIKPHSYESLDLELENMIEKEILTTEEKNVVNKDSIVNFFKSDIGRRLIDAKKIYREQSFLMKEKEFIIEGIIDCYFIDKNDKLVLIDYKTDKVISENKYKDQLNMYQRALEEIYKKPVDEKYIYWLTEGISTMI